MYESACESEVTRLRRQIEQELEAMQRGLGGYALGSARHEFIRMRMDRVGSYQERLTEKVGEERANQMVYNTYIQVVG